MIKYKSGREIESELLERIRDYMSDECIVDALMCYFSSDDTVDALTDIANDYDIDVSDITEDEDEDEDEEEE